MKEFRRVVYVLLNILTGFLAFTGFLGGLGILLGWNTPPLKLLEGTMFKDFTIPGLSLFFLVGGSALLTTVLLLRKNKFSVLFATVAGIIIMFFEFVEVMAVGSPDNVAFILQIFYFGLGVAITIASLGIWFIDLFTIRPA